jgi:hypothetical protein
MHVSLLLLPPLEKYTSSTRFGIRSRGWSETHDGRSYMIVGVKFVKGVDSTGAEVHGPSRRMRIDAGLEVDEEEEALMGLLGLAKGDKIVGGRNGFERLTPPKSSGDERDADDVEMTDGSHNAATSVEGADAAQGDNVQATESFVRGEPVPLQSGNGIVGLGMGSWWKGMALKARAEKAEKERKQAE